MKPLPKNYDHKEREKHWQEQWAKSDVYAFRDDKPRSETFVIDTPPPTVSGVLHMGHIFSYTQADFVARYQRMSGKDVFYPMGFDDNGLPTERLVEKIKGKKAAQYESREAFVKDCREVVKDAEEEFRKLFKSAALSVDWKQEYQTISDDVQKLSQASFLDMLKKGEAYRKLQPMLWDPVDQTAIAQAEIVDKEMASHFNDIAFGIEGSDEKIVIGTTRPELIGACVAVFYHPDDTRYQHLKGKTAVTPLFGVKVPILADDAVKLDKGTGLVMCCTFGDETDIMWWEKHKLPTRVILNNYGKITFPDADGLLLSPPGHNGIMNALQGKALEVAEKIQGKKISNSDTKHPGAREIIIEELKAAGLLVKQEPITHAVKCAERSGAPLEILPTYQWFVKVLDKKAVLNAKVKECQWHPEYMRVRAEQWIDGLNWDWCISRQRFFGVPFPVWYEMNIHPMDDKPLKIVYASKEQLPVDPLVVSPAGYQKIPDSETENYGFRVSGNFHGKVHINPEGKIVALFPDKDVMDTWATSSLTPFISANNPNIRHSGESRNPEFCLDPGLRRDLIPADIRPQAHEIIRTWAFYTIVKAHLHADTIPWKNLMISGWCLAADKTKMSKSKGNVVTPVDLIEEKGTDAVRYWASTSRLGADTAFSEDLLKIGKKLVTKLWNASNFAALNLDKLSGAPSTAAKDTQAGYISEPLDLWILSRLHQCIKKATTEFERFEYCDARVAIEDFFWNDFCDNYLELVKARAYGESGGNQQSALYAIYHCLNGILRLFAPFVPHITEELYSHIFDGRGSIHQRGTWPRSEDYPYDAEAELSGMAAVDVLNVIRKAKSEAGVSIKFPVTKVEVAAKGDAPAPNWKHLESVLSDLKAAGTISEAVESKETDLPAMTEKGWFSVRVTLAKVEEQRRNAEQSPNEKLEGKVLHGPGTPDMSKHVVKLQVNSLPETLERQK